jgi:hypothetical protein
MAVFSFFGILSRYSWNKLKNFKKCPKYLTTE